MWIGFVGMVNVNAKSLEMAVFQHFEYSLSLKFYVAFLCTHAINVTINVLRFSKVHAPLEFFSLSLQ